jgi:hypothetical protein
LCKEYFIRHIHGKPDFFYAGFPWRRPDGKSGQPGEWLPLKREKQFEDNLSTEIPDVGRELLYLSGL